MVEFFGTTAKGIGWLEVIHQFVYDQSLNVVPHYMSSEVLVGMNALSDLWTGESVANEGG